MRVFKDHSFLVFDVDGKQCKYDFATHKAYGFSGKEVKSINAQLAKHSVDEIIASCDQPGYGYFLKDVSNTWYGSQCCNIGTLLRKAEYYSRLEPFYTAGIKHIDGINYIKTPFRDVPSGLLKLCRQHNIPFDDDLVHSYKSNPDFFNIMFNLDYTTITEKDLLYIINWNRIPLNLIQQYGYSAKSLLLYLDRLATFEALPPKDALVILRDTIQMSSAISPKYDKYPRYLRTTHDIVQRNYNRMKTQFDAEMFAHRVKPQMEHTVGEYAFIYPKSPQDIKDEAVQQNNCVASYIDRVIRGECDILFMRNVESKDKSLVTLEVVDGKVVQKRQHYNYPTTKPQDEAIAKWEQWYAKQVA